MLQALWDGLFAIEKNIVFASIKRGFVLTFPIVLIGTGAVLINSILLPLVSFLLPAWIVTMIGSFCGMIYDSSVGCISLYLSVVIGYYFARYRNANNILVRLMSILTGVVCVIISVGGPSSEKFVSYMGVIGVLPAIVVELLAIQVFLYLIRAVEFRHRDSSLGVDDNLKISVVSILPMLLTIILFTAIQYITVHFLHIEDLYQMLSNFFRTLFTDDVYQLLNGVLFSGLVNLLWVFGIHGGNAMDPISEELLVPLIADPDAIISKSFLDIFAQLGGSGSTLCLLLAILLVSKSKTTRDITRTAAPMILFNINELMVFGLPIMFNPILMIPFVLVPIVSLCIAFAATVIGFIPVVTEVVNWTVPIFLSGYLGTGTINGIIVQLVILICGILIYLPFVKLLDAFQVERELRILDELISIFRSNEESGIHAPMMTRTDALGQVARNLGQQLQQDVKAQKVEMFYQPLMDAEDGVAGAEALLRWKYHGQQIYPPFVIALAREVGVLDEMTLRSVETICQTICDVNEAITPRVHIALNVVASQLDDIALIEQVIAIAQEKQVAGQIHVELTEETSLSGFVNIDHNIRRLYAEGIGVAIDDFGMGQTSINYLKEHPFEYVKIDGSLVKQVLYNPRCTQIITSIVDLGNSLNYKVIAEYVETLEMKEKLLELGCCLFQGYYYSPALPKSEFMAYCLALEEPSEQLAGGRSN